MSREERDKKRSKRKKIRAFFIAFIFIYLIFRSVPALHASTLKTAIVEEGTLEDKVELKAIVVKDEKVYTSKGEGKVKLYKKEGERVKVGTEIAQVSLLDKDASLKNELEEINRKIESVEKIQKERETVKSDKDKANKNSNEVLDNIQNSIANKNYEEIPNLKEELYFSLGKQKDVSGGNTLSEQTLENLNREKEKIKKEIANNSIKYISKEAGIVSYEIDGLENIFSPKNLSKYNVEDIKEAELCSKTTKNGNETNAEDILFKIVDNHHFYLLVQIDDIKQISPLKEGDSIGFLIDNDSQKLKGKIRRIDKKGRQAAMVIESDFFCHNYYNKRKVNINLIKSSYEGYKIPIKSISKKDGVDGVYIKDISGIIKFKPIKILGKNKEYAIISSGDQNNNIDINGNNKPVKTVKLFDEILLSNGKIKEGRIVD